MIKVKTADLQGAALDWAVAVAAGLPLSSEAVQDGYIMIGTGRGDMEVYVPSTHWMDGGPLIDRFRVGIYCDYTPSETITANVTGSGAVATGETFLIAACRAIVAAHLGDTVQIPDELAERVGR